MGGTASPYRRRVVGRVRFVAAAALVVAAAALVVGSCSSGPAPKADVGIAAESANRIVVTSPAFAEGAAIPEKFSCEGDNTPPPLRWAGVPTGAAGLAIAVTDPDAPRGTFVHWTVWNLAATTTALDGPHPPGATVGTAGSGQAEYVGMCPPRGQVHRYRFTVYALSAPVAQPAGTDGAAAIASMERLATAKGTLTGTFP